MFTIALIFVVASCFMWGRKTLRFRHIVLFLVVAFLSCGFIAV